MDEILRKSDEQEREQHGEEKRREECSYSPDHPNHSFQEADDGLLS